MYLMKVSNQMNLVLCNFIKSKLVLHLIKLYQWVLLFNLQEENWPWNIQPVRHCFYWDEIKCELCYNKCSIIQLMSAPSWKNVFDMISKSDRLGLKYDVINKTSKFETVLKTQARVVRLYWNLQLWPRSWCNQFVAASSKVKQTLV